MSSARDPIGQFLAASIDWHQKKVAKYAAQMKTLEPTWFIDSDSPEVGDFAADSAGGLSDPTKVAVALFHAVRDGIRYDPYGVADKPASYRA